MTNTKVETIKGMDRQQLVDKFREFVQQKPGFGSDYNASDYYYYKKDADFNRSIKDYELVEIFDNLTDEELAFNVFNDRLTINENKEFDYIAGQFWPVEYQGGARDAFTKAKRIFKLKEEGKWGQ